MLASPRCGCRRPSAGRRAAAQARHANPEGIQIGLSTDRVAITADFTGADLTIFGALDNADPLVSRQGRYDVIVVLEGPARAGRGAPQGPHPRHVDQHPVRNLRERAGLLFGRHDAHAAGHHRPEELPATVARRRQHLSPAAEEGDDPVTIDEFTDALRDRKKATGLYSVRVGGVQFLSQNLFRATLALAPNVPVGTHKARAFLFKNGLFVKETSAQLAIVKSGFEQSIFGFARRLQLLLRPLRGALAMLTGWLGRIVFRRD